MKKILLILITAAVFFISACTVMPAQKLSESEKNPPDMPVSTISFTPEPGELNFSQVSFSIKTKP
ncbi:MAG: hypothetical protein FWG44_08705, partial [Oscillospiraceae bacterium]|nr:hypothetical protein [Oscillospiraceae bacterium]